MFDIERFEKETTLSSEFTDEMHFEPEILSLENMQLLQVELWSDLISDDSISINTMYNTLLPIEVHQIPFQVSSFITLINKLSVISVWYVGSTKAETVDFETCCLPVEIVINKNTTYFRYWARL